MSTNKYGRNNRIYHFARPNERTKNALIINRCTKEQDTNKLTNLSEYLATAKYFTYSEGIWLFPL